VSATTSTSRPTPTGPIPLLCDQCGCPVEAADGRTLRCPHCGAFDRLPAHNLERALELKRRLQRAARAVVPLDGVALRLAGLYEDGRRFWPALLALALAAAALATLLRVELAPLAALLVAVTATVGRRHYRRALRPHVLARSPLGPELPPRCRACAGELRARSRSRRAAFVRCRYCSTASLAAR
jgi:hypothetical protein